MLWALAVTGLAILTGVLILGVASARLEQSALRVFLIGWIVVPYVLSGVLAWWRRPASRLGPLMMLTGFVMGLTPMQWSSQPLVHSVGNFLDMLPAALFLHVFLAFPTGRLRDRVEQALVAVTYAITLGLQMVKILLGANPDSLFVVVAAPAAGTVVEQVSSPWWPAASSSGLSCCTGAGRATIGWTTAGDPRRRRVQLRARLLALLYIGGLLVVVHRADSVGHLRRPRAGADRVPLRPARPSARPRPGGAAGRAAVRPTTDLQAPLARRPARPLAPAVLLAA